MNVRRTSCRRGFTLIELMVAVAILGLILVMLAGSFHAVAAGKTQAENRIAAEQQSRSVLWQLSNEIRGAVATPNVPSHVIVIGRGQMENNAPLDSLSIATLDPGHRRALEGFGAEDTVSYTTATNPNHRGWSLLLRAQSSSLLTHGNAGAAAPVVLADNLLSIHFRYFDGNIWTESWNSEALPPGRQLPQAIGVDLVVASSGAPVRLATMVTLPMAFAQW
jgi:prepilin-type N-terminal cleavage/methylation domain-containing protein